MTESRSKSHQTRDPASTTAMLLPRVRILTVTVN